MAPSWKDRLFGSKKGEAPEKAPAAPEKPGGRPSGAKRILIVDDSEIERMVLSEILTQAGYEVVEAENGQVAIDTYRASPADLIITDIMMPEKNGIQMMIELDREFPDAKVVAASTGGDYGPQINYDMAARMGAHTVPKPYQPEEVLAVVKKLIG